MTAETGEASTAPRCVIVGCGRGRPRLAVDGYRVCAACGELVQARLADVPRMFDLLSASPVSGGLVESTGQPVFESKSPANDDHIALADPRSTDGPIGVMQAWQHRLRRMRNGAAVEPTCDVGALVRSMLANLPFVSAQACAGEFYGEMYAVWRRLRYATDPHLVKPNVIAYCDGIGEAECGTPLYAPKTGYDVECFVCGGVYEGLEQVALARKANDYDTPNAGQDW